MKRRRSYTTLVNLLVLVASLPLATIQAADHHLGNLIAVGTVDKVLERLPLLRPEDREEEEGNFWRFLLREEGKRKATSTFYLAEQRRRATTSELAVGHDYAWSLEADARLFSDQIHLSGEYGWTRYHRDPFVVAPVQDDSAYKLQLSYQPLQIISFFETPLNWNIGVEHKRVGDFFWSPTEPVENKGVSLWKGFTHLDWQGLVFDTWAMQEIHNRGSSSFRAPQQIHRIQLKGQYQFHHFELPLWLGLSSLGMKFSRESTEEVEQLSSRAEFKVNFSYQDWSWNLRHSLNWDKFETMAAEPDYLAVTAAEARLKLLSNGLSLAPTLHYQHRGADFGANEQLSVGVNSRAVFVPEQFEGQFRVAVKQDWNKRRLKRIYTTSGDLSWRLTRPKAQIPSIRLFLEGRYQAIADQINCITKGYRVFLGFALE
ncbi:hypothetical protein [Nitrosococcus wardiae]|uniref:DUF560 domain-containing protein n=1 Tax=Nitrosococcus wardiae TaxID=1814290 RepID=A0A4P7C1B9_9GAMM|nr:hypothetical protein [Nitrosococcus wardiae]QBQ55380.1 hypothetical protein E3U44_13310 [Nitrosococcus wardiae]